MKKVIVFCAGHFTDWILKKQLRDDVEIVFICDNNESRWGEKISEYTIVSPKKINEVSFDKILISSANTKIMDEIEEQLETMGIDLQKTILPLGNLEIFETPLDEIIKIEKRARLVPFSYEPVKYIEEFHGETWKSRDRRKKEGFFDKYCTGLGLDIGYAGKTGAADLIIPGCCGWDIENGDAQYLQNVRDESFDFVYSSHCLEHVNDVRIALKNWFRVVKVGGYLLIAVPHRDLYEKKKRLPSRWNGDHKHMFLIGKKEPPHTLDIVEEIREGIKDNYSIIYVKECSAGHTISDPYTHSNGEYQIEVVIKKMK